MKIAVEVVTTTDNAIRVHAAGCSHTKRDQDLVKRSGGSVDLLEYTTRREAVLDIFGGHEELEEEPEAWATYAKRSGLTFSPCCKLP